jgi:H+/Cl- antiporter ClcA
VTAAAPHGEARVSQSSEPSAGEGGPTPQPGDVSADVGRARPAELLTPQARRLVALAVPAAVVGVGSSIALILVSRVAGLLEHWLWSDIPGSLGIDPNGPAWIFGVLTLTGFAVGLVIVSVPGHAGEDPATEGLVAPVLPLRSLPGLVVATILVLAGGVSLGPEYPIMTINIALAVFLGSRAIARIPGRAWIGLAFAGTIGALFGTPVAAALLLSESMTASDEPLWDRLFAPLVAAAAGAQTTVALGGEGFALSLPDYPTVQVGDILVACIIAVVAAVVAMVAVYAFPISHEAFSRLRHPVLITLAGGVVLGVLGAIGGPITLFKGLEQMKTLTDNAASYSAGGLGAIALIKLAALVVAATSRFRGGRIFPAVFVGVAFGLFVSALLPGIPAPIAVSTSVLGVLLAITRSGWLAIFVGIALVPDTQLLPVICIAALPAWLIVTGRPIMQADPERPPASGPEAPATAA